MSVLVEEGVRRLRNHSRGLDWEKSRQVMENWCRKLRNSGYPETMRHEVIKAAVDRFEKMCHEEDQGIRRRRGDGEDNMAPDQTQPGLSPFYHRPNSRRHDANQCHGALGSIRRCGKRLPPLLAFLAFHPTSATKLNKYNFGDEVVL